MHSWCAQSEAHELPKAAKERSTWFYQNIECATLGTLLDVMLIQCATWHVTITPFSYKIVRKMHQSAWTISKVHTQASLTITLLLPASTIYSPVPHTLLSVFTSQPSSQPCCAPLYLLPRPGIRCGSCLFTFGCMLFTCKTQHTFVPSRGHMTNSVTVLYLKACILNPAEWFTFQCQYT